MQSLCMHSNSGRPRFLTVLTLRRARRGAKRPFFSIEDVEKGNLPNNNTTTSTINIFIFVQNYK